MINSTSNLPIVNMLAAAMNINQVTISFVAKKAGIPTSTIHRWFHENAAPRVDNIEACLNVCGKTLILGDRNG